ncbi:MAG: hypothetical protein NVSMB17_01490 [Candidatus Dormibacteria bacterium]
MGCSTGDAAYIFPVADPAEPKPDVDSLVARLRERVEERRRSGQYPEGLEADLDRHFEMAVAASLRTRADLEALLHQLRAASAPIDLEAVPTISSLPMGSSFHQAFARLVHRHTRPIAERVHEHTDAVNALLEAIVTQELPDIVARIDATMERLAAYERLPAATDDTSRALAARLERLEQQLARLGATPTTD